MSSRRVRRPTALAIVAGAVLAAVTGAPLPTGVATASHTPTPTSVTIAGDLQSELGCPGDWDPACAVTRLADARSDGWVATFTVPAIAPW